MILPFQGLKLNPAKSSTATRFTHGSEMSFAFINPSFLPPNLNLLSHKSNDRSSSDTTRQEQHRRTTMGVLTVFLEKCTDLKDKDVMSKSDPYVLLEIEQDNFVRTVVVA